MAAFNSNGKVVSVGDRVSIRGTITTVGSGSNPDVTIQPPLSASTFVAKARDIRTPECTAPGPAQGNAATVGNPCTATGLVTAVTGSGNTATLTVTLSDSGSSISIVAGACNSDNV